MESYMGMPLRSMECLNTQELPNIRIKASILE